MRPVPAAPGASLAAGLAVLLQLSTAAAGSHGHGGGCGTIPPFPGGDGRAAAAPAGTAAHGGHASAPPADAEAHRVHTPQAGGRQLFMAPDGVHHLEPVYSAACGLRVVLYDARTRPIRAEGFVAFARVVPSVESEVEHARFVLPSADGTVLEARLAEELTPPFEIELHVRFPGNEEPELFNVLIPAEP